MKRNGFTLIELIIVLAILGILGTMVAVRISDNSTATTSTVSTTVVQPTGPAPTCSGGYLLKGSTAITNSAGEAVKC